MHGLVMRSSCDDLLEIEVSLRRAKIAQCFLRACPLAEKLKQSAQGRLLSSASGVCREPKALWVFSRFPRAYPGFGNRALRLIGVGAGVGQKWIAITSTATAGGHRLALLQCLKAAGAHSGSDVLAAILAWARRRRRRHRKISQRE